jgi:TonB family protein
MKSNNDDTAALIGTIIVHLILIVILYFSILRTIVPNEDSGILVNFGDAYTVAGIYEPPYTARPPQQETPPQPQPKPIAPKTEPLITQDKEKTVSIPDKKKNEKQVTDEKAQREREEAERRRREEEARKRREEERRKQQEAISNRVSNAFGMASAQESRQGDATAAGIGNQGNPFGNTDTGANQNTGGFGTFNLDGRYIGQGGLPRPTDRGQEEGKIVINITVDPNGNVIMAEIGRGTNIDNAQMRTSAIAAAKRAKFNKIKGTDNQNGTITYIYKLT